MPAPCCAAWDQQHGWVVNSRKNRYRNNHGANSTPGLEEPLPLATAPEPDSPVEEAPADGPAEDPDAVFEGSARLRVDRDELASTPLSTREQPSIMCRSRMSRWSGNERVTAEDYTLD